VLFFIELKTRRVHTAGATTNPDSAWVTQQARNLSGDLRELGVVPRFLICDRDTKFTGSFDAVFEAEAARIISTPIRAPNGNAHAERWVGTCERSAWTGSWFEGDDTSNGSYGSTWRTTTSTGPTERWDSILRLIGEMATPASTGSGRDLTTTDPGRTHQRVRSGGVMIEFSDPTGLFRGWSH
jgi:hypothetical protein